MNGTTHQMELSSTNALTVLQTAVDALPNNGGLIVVKSPFSATGQLNITSIGVNIVSDVKQRYNYVPAEINVAIERIKINATIENLNGIYLRGLVIQDLVFYATGGGSYNIVGVDIVECSIRATDASTHRGVVFEGTKTNEFFMDIHFERCLLYDTKGSETYGLITFDNLASGTSQVYFDHCCINLSGNNETVVLVTEDARIGLEISFDTCNIFFGDYTVQRLVHIKGGGSESYATGIRTRFAHGIFECHPVNTTLFDIDTDASAGKKFFGAWVVDSLISCAGTYVNLIDNDCTNWTTENQTLFMHNNLILASAKFDVGDVGTGLQFFISENSGFEYP